MRHEPTPRHSIAPLDLSFYHLDSRSTPQSIAAFLVLDGMPDVEEIRNRFRAAASIFPRLHERLVVSAGRWYPRAYWERADDIDLGDLVLFDANPGLTNISDLAATAGMYFSRPLDLSRPLWRFHLFGSSDGRGPVGALFIGHHTMTDGFGGLEILRTVTDGSGDVSIAAQLPRRSEPNAQLRNRRRVTVGKVIRELIEPPIASALNGENSPSRELHVRHFPFPELLAMRAHYGVSINDVYLGLVSSALESYSRDVAERMPAEPRIIIPVNLRSAADADRLGNLLTGVTIRLPASGETLPDRLLLVHERTTTMKRSGIARGYALIARMNARLPAFLQRPFCRAFARRTSCICTNLPNSSSPRKLAGVEIRSTFAAAALMEGHGLAFSLVTYNENAHVAVVVDPGIVRDGPRLLDHFIKAKDELLATLPIAHHALLSTDGQRNSGC